MPILNVDLGDPNYFYREFPSALDCFLANADMYREMGVTLFSVNYPSFYRQLCKEKATDRAFPEMERGRAPLLPPLLNYDISTIRIAKRKYGRNVSAASRTLGYKPHQIRKIWGEMDKESMEAQ